MAEDPPTPPEPPPPPQDAPPPPAPPPAAKTVLEGTKTERELILEREVEQHRTPLKSRETPITELEDENRQLTTPPPKPATRSGSGSAKKKRRGLTFFD